MTAWKPSEGCLRLWWCLAVAVLGVISDCQHCVGKCFNMSGSGLG